MKEFLEDGRIIEVILALMVLEALFLSAWFKWKRRGIAPIQLVANLSAGMFLMLAILGALQNAPVWMLGTSLLAALFAHIVDLAVRWSESELVPTPFGAIVATKHRLFERSL